MSMVIQGYEGLDIPYRANFRRPVQIVRQFKPHSETNPYSPIAPYHRYIGLSIAPQFGRESRRIRHIPIGITNPIGVYA